MYQMRTGSSEPEDYSSGLETSTDDDEDYQPYVRRTVKKTITARRKKTTKTCPKPGCPNPNTNDDMMYTPSHFLANSPKYVNQIYHLYVQVKRLVDPKATVHSLANFDAGEAFLELSKLLRMMKNLPEPLNSSLKDTEAWIQHVERSDTADNFCAPVWSTDAGCQTEMSEIGLGARSDSEDVGTANGLANDDDAIITTEFDFYRQTEACEDDAVKDFSQSNDSESSDVSEDALEQPDDCEFDESVLKLRVKDAINVDEDLGELLQLERSRARLSLLNCSVCDFVCLNPDIIDKLESGIASVQPVSGETLKKFSKYLSLFGSIQLNHLVNQMTLKSRINMIYSNKRPTGLFTTPSHNAEMTTRETVYEDKTVYQSETDVREKAHTSESKADEAAPVTDFYREARSRPSMKVEELTNSEEDNLDSESDLIVSSAYTINEATEKTEDEDGGLLSDDNSNCSVLEPHESCSDNESVDEYLENGCMNGDVDEGYLNGESESETEDQENVCPSRQEGSDKEDEIDTDLDEQTVVTEDAGGEGPDSSVEHQRDDNDNGDDVVDHYTEDIEETVTAEYRMRECRVVLRRRISNVESYRDLLSQEDQFSDSQSEQSSKENAQPMLQKAPLRRKEGLLETPTSEPVTNDKGSAVAGREPPSRHRDRVCHSCHMRFYTRRELNIHESTVHCRDIQYDRGQEPERAPRLSFKRRGSRSPLRRDEPRPKHFKQVYRSRERAPRPINEPVPRKYNLAIQRWSDDRRRPSQHSRQRNDSRHQGNQKHYNQTGTSRYPNYYESPNRRYSAEPPSPKFEYRRARHEEADSWDPTIVFTKHGRMVVEYSDEEYELNDQPWGKTRNTNKQQRRRHPSYEEVRAKQNIWNLKRQGRNPFIN